jgi:hypothetical protein
MQAPCAATSPSVFESRLRYCALCDSSFRSFRKRITGSQDCAGYFSYPLNSPPPEAVEQRLSGANSCAQFCAAVRP